MQGDFLFMDIRFFTEEIKFNLKNRNKLRKWICRVIAYENKKCGAINYIFCSDNYLLKINQQYLKHNTFTDIVSFENNDAELINGDIFISIERVKENSKQLGLPFSNELHRVMIHGVLHFLGYSDKSKIQKEKMRKQEDACLKKFI